MLDQSLWGVTWTGAQIGAGVGAVLGTWSGLTQVMAFDTWMDAVTNMAMTTAWTSALWAIVGASVVFSGTGLFFILLRLSFSQH